MASIKSKDSVAERIAFAYLRKENIYFQKHYKKASGKPDIALPRKKIAVFIDGDFWHGRDLEETTARLPEVYWRGKIARNVERDKEINKELRVSGWKILRVWESDIKRKRTRDVILQSIKTFLTQ